MCQGGTLHSAGCHLCILVAECHPALRIRFGTVCPYTRVCKVSPRDFLPVLGVPQLKITNRSFWPSCDQMVLLTSLRPKLRFGHFEVGPWVKFSKFWPGGLGTFRQWFRKFPSRIFYPFLTSHGRKLQIGLFDCRATKWCFWLACDQNLCLVFLTIVRPGKASKIRD